MSLSAISLRRSSPVVRFQARFHGGSDKPRDCGLDKPRDDTAGNAVQKQGKGEKRMTRNRSILNFIKEMKIDAVIGDDIPPGVHKLQFHTKEEFDKLTTILSSKDLPQKFGLEDPKARVHEILLDYATKMAIVDGSVDILSNLSKFLNERYFEKKKATTVSVSDILSQLDEALKIINEKVEPEKGSGSGKEEKKERSAKEEKKGRRECEEKKEQENGKSEAEESGSENEPSSSSHLQSPILQPQISRFPVLFSLPSHSPLFSLPSHSRALSQAPLSHLLSSKLHPTVREYQIW